MRTQRQVVDYALRRRAVLREVYAGRVGTYEVCDASPYLISAAKFHGEPSDDRCPVCRRENVTYVHYIYGDELRQSAGQARRKAELSVLGRAALPASGSASATGPGGGTRTRMRREAAK